MVNAFPRPISRDDLRTQAKCADASELEHLAGNWSVGSLVVLAAPLSPEYKR
jgi:hypothetical protein